MNFLKKLRLFDYMVIIILIAVLVVGALTYTHKRATSSNQIETSTDIELDIFLKGVAMTSKKPLIVGDKETFITIRNVPITKLKIKEVKYSKRKITIPTFNSKKPYIIVDDGSASNIYDFLVKVTGNAKITKDGDAVLDGNKVKVGLPTTLEGAQYKLNGVISNIYISPNSTDVSHEDLDKHTKINQDVQ